MTSKFLTITLALCLAAPVAAQTSTTSTRPSEASATISDANFAVVAQEIRELKHPEFRARLREQLLILTKASDSAERRQASLTLGAEALSDLSAHQESVGGPTSWLYDLIVKALRNFGGSDAEAIIARYALKWDKGPSPAKDLNAAVTSLSDPTNPAAAREKAKAAILTGQITSDGILGHLLRLHQLNSPSLPDLLSAVLTVEERQPGFIPMRMVPFFSGVFLWDSPREIQVKFLQMVVSRTRGPLEDRPNDMARREVVNALSAISTSTKTVAPDLYPEVAARLTSLNSNFLAMQSEREALDARIKASSDPLEYLQSEAERANSADLRRSLLVRAAALALTQGKLRKAVDLEVSAYGQRAGDASYMDRFLGDVTTAAIKQQQADDAEYAISNIITPLSKVNSLLKLSKHYQDVKDNEKSKAAITRSLKILDQAADDNDKVKVTIALAGAAMAVDSSIAYEAMRLTVDTINKLPPPDDKKASTSYRSFMPRVTELIDAYRLFGSQEAAAAFALAQEIKFPELRVAALLGAYSAQPSK